jgi:O-acetyl-ADP-ribose deacetylase (regulator of RNase III)
MPTEIKIGGTVIQAYQGDITDEKSDAIVNAANTSLRGGGGVDGAIHRKGGPVILEECKKYPGCATGEVRTTSAGNLKAKYVIHTVGPVYQGSGAEPALLTNCYINALEEAVKLKCRTIAFPSISTGVYNYPIQQATEIAVSTVVEYIKSHAPGLNGIYFVLFSEKDLLVYRKVLSRYK